MKNKILVTGGLGYIGSHTVISLIENNFEVVIVDNLSNSTKEVLDRIEEITQFKPVFVQLDMCDPEQLAAFFNSEEGKNISATIHFAAFKYVGESVNNPLKYYHNNLFALINLLNAMASNGVNKLVFSSSCTVYGEAAEVPVNEKSSLKEAASPYGNTKKISEEIIRDAIKMGKLDSIILRYFNPIGAHPSALLGEYSSKNSDNIMPALSEVAIGKRDKFKVYGGNYDTIDGTCVRDYIDIMDLAEAHVKALTYLFVAGPTGDKRVFNIGTGTGYSVLEVIKAFEAAAGKKIAYEIVGRRKGDVAIVYADPSIANEILQWKAQKSLDQMVQTAWQWQQNL